MTTLNAHDYTVGEILTAATMDGVTADLNALLAEVEGSCYIETGSYAGDGSTGQTVSLTDSDLVISDLWIVLSGSDNDSVPCYFTTADLVDDDADGLCFRISGGGTTLQDRMIKSVGTGSFVVDDGGSDANPNKNGSTYYYIARGTH